MDCSLVSRESHGEEGQEQIPTTPTPELLTRPFLYKSGRRQNRCRPRKEGLIEGMRSPDSSVMLSGLLRLLLACPVPGKVHSHTWRGSNCSLLLHGEIEAYGNETVWPEVCSTLLREGTALNKIFLFKKGSGIFL